MSREVLRELVSAISRLRREPADVERIDEWAGRLEQHLAELELLAAMALPDETGPAFVPALEPRASRPHPRSRRGVQDPASPSLAAGHQAAELPGVEAPTGQHGAGEPPSSARLDGPPAVQGSVLGLIGQLGSGQLSPEALVERAFEAARRLAHLNIFIELFEERARQEAARLSEHRGSPGPAGAPPGGVALLRGVPVAVKDLVAIKGYAMTGGARVLKLPPAAGDAEAVRRLRVHGAIVFGAANLHELAYGITSENPHFGPVRNPRNPDHMAGGSSGGSAAAVAAGIVPAALGTDTGGSIRIPAAACGVAGLKPTYGRVSTEGVFPLAWSLDHVGPLAATAADAAVLFAAMADEPTSEEQRFARALVDGVTAGRAGQAAAERSDKAAAGLPESSRQAVALALLMETRRSGGASGGREGLDVAAAENLARAAMEGLRLAYPPDDWLGPVDPAVRRALARVRQRLGEVGFAPGTAVELPPPGHFRVAQFAIIQAEAASVHRERLRQHWDEFGHDVRVRLKIGEFLTAVDYLQAQRMRRQLCDKMAAVFEAIDVLVLPVLPVLPPPLGTRLVQVEGEVEPVQRAMTRFTGPFNLTGLPAMAIPVATAPGGLPIGVQLVARWGRELDLFRAAIALEALMSW